ncbi:MAG: RagB/SusD family nutrient uptake outer membrane protein [Bacteroidota bacterium]
MKKIQIILLALVLFIGPSCVSLDEDTRAVLLLENLAGEGDINAALAPIYRSMLNLIYRPHNWIITGYGADDITTWWAGNKAPLRVFDRFDYGNGENSEINWLNEPWEIYWQIIYYSNSLIANLKTSTASPELVANADAEARWWRAYAYLLCVKAHGNMPVILDDTTPTGEEQRATVLENYQHIEADLLIAEQNLPHPSEVSEVGRLSSAAAKAVLADLYSTWAGWPVKDAGKYAISASKAKEIMDMGHYELMPIEDLWKLESQNSLESVFAIQFSPSEDIRNHQPADNNFHESRGWSDMFPERQFFFDFPEGPRKDITFRTEIPQRGFANGAIFEKDPATVPWQDSQRKHPQFLKFNLSEDLTVNNRAAGFRAIELYRYAEILLIYAEATARSSGGMATGDAAEAYNQVRRRAAGLPYDMPVDTIDVASVSAQEILDEKGWELAGEFKRWYDLVRTETVAEIAARRDPTEEVPLAIDPSEINWKHYIAPIPFQAISTSSLQQNPEGFKIQ